MVRKYYSIIQKIIKKQQKFNSVLQSYCRRNKRDANQAISSISWKERDVVSPHLFVAVIIGGALHHITDGARDE